jgi:hypothetical protein
MADDGSDTYKSLHDGAAAFGRGCFMAIRNARAEVPTEAWNAFAEPHGIQVETPVPQPPNPGQTETLIPFEFAKEFDSFADYSIQGEP